VYFWRVLQIALKIVNNYPKGKKIRVEAGKLESSQFRESSALFLHQFVLRVPLKIFKNKK